MHSLSELGITHFSDFFAKTHSGPRTDLQTCQVQKMDLSESFLQHAKHGTQRVTVFKLSPATSFMQDTSLNFQVKHHLNCKTAAAEFSFCSGIILCLISCGLSADFAVSLN